MSKKAKDSIVITVNLLISIARKLGISEKQIEEDVYKK